MLIQLDASEFLKIIDRNKARFLSHIEKKGADASMVSDARRAFGFVRDDLINESKKHEYGLSEEICKTDM